MRKLLIAVLAASLLPGCALYENSLRREEARQLSWTGPGAGPCAWGGVTERAQEHCAMIEWGPVGSLHAINEKTRARLGPNADCIEHVETVRAQLARHRGMTDELLFTCPIETRARNECHVSLLVTLADGERYVLDNGAVVTAALGLEGVATFENFARQVEGVYWLGFPPSARELAALDAGVKPATIASLPLVR